MSTEPLFYSAKRKRILWATGSFAGLGFLLTWRVVVYWLSAVPLGLPYFFWGSLALGSLLLSLFLTYMVWAFWGVRYIFTRQHLIIRSGWLEVSLPLVRLRFPKNIQEKTRELIELPTNWAYWLAFPFAKSWLPVQLDQADRFWLTPSDPVAFRGMFYRMLKIQERERQLTAADMSPRREVLRWKFPLRNFWRYFSDPVFLVLTLLNFFLWYGLGAFIFWAMGFLPAFTILKYSFSSGIEWEGGRYFLFWLWVVMMSCGIGLSSFAAYLFPRERLAAYMTLSVYAFLVLLIGVYIFGLIQFVGQITI